MPGPGGSYIGYKRVVWPYIKHSSFVMLLQIQRIDQEKYP